MEKAGWTGGISLQRKKDIEQEQLVKSINKLGEITALQNLVFSRLKLTFEKKYGFLEKSKVLLDLCAAPGSWCQVAAETMAANSIILGVDLAPIKPIPRAITFRSDITTDKCRSTIRSHLKTWKVDTVLHDGAPNVGVAWAQDAYSQADLALQAMKLATEFLKSGGTFVTKIFRSKDYASLLWVFNQLFDKVEATKPPSSRTVSAEIFVVCQGFKAPSRIDPRFLDARAVFADLSAPTPNHEAKVFDPEKKRRRREGYDNNSGLLLYKQLPAHEFIETNDPVAMLGSLNELSFEQGSVNNLTLTALERLPETTPEIRQCCSDLKVLGRKDFRSLLKWRLTGRELFGLDKPKTDLSEDNVEISELAVDGEDTQEQEDLRSLFEEKSKKRKRRDKRDREQKQRELKRLRMHMQSPMEIGLEQTGPSGADSLFTMASINGASGDGDKVIEYIPDGGTEDRHSAEDDASSISEDEAESDSDLLDLQLDALYQQHIEKKKNRNVRSAAREAITEQENGEWSGFSSPSAVSGSHSGSDDESEPESVCTPPSVEQSSEKHILSQRDLGFFDQKIFREISHTTQAQDHITNEHLKGPAGLSNAPEKRELSVPAGPLPSGANMYNSQSHDRSENGGEDRRSRGSTPLEEEREGRERQSKHEFENDIEIITAEAMTLAQQIASGSKGTQKIIDDSFNKLSFYDRSDLPDWFLDDEKKHSMMQKPITAAAAKMIQEKLRALNARPIKKVREAKDRKRYRAMRRLEKLRKKSALLADGDSMTEQDKASSIAKLMSRASKSKPKARPKLVVARGGNRGVSGRPKGVKGRYKIVDARLKKDMRAAKRLSKK